MSDLLYTVFTNIAPAVEEQFNAWQETEHGPYLLTLPGYHSVIRYKDMDKAHRYANFWHISSMRDFDNPERLVRINTPWGKYLSPYRDRRLDFYVQDGGLDQDPPEAEMAPAFRVLIMDTYTDEADAHFGITEELRKKADAIRAIPGVMDMRIFHSYEGRGRDENCVFYYLDSPVREMEDEVLPGIIEQLGELNEKMQRSRLVCMSQNAISKALLTEEK